MVQARIVLGRAAAERATKKTGTVGSGSGKGNDRDGAGGQRGPGFWPIRRGGQARDSAANARVEDRQPRYQQASAQVWVTRCRGKLMQPPEARSDVCYAGPAPGHLAEQIGSCRTCFSSRVHVRVRV